MRVPVGCACLGCVSVCVKLQCVIVIVAFLLTSCLHSLFNQGFRGLCFVYFVAFSSFYVQFPGLVGSNGLMPGDAFLNSLLKYQGEDVVYKLPCIWWLARYIGNAHVVSNSLPISAHEHNANYPVTTMKPVANHVFTILLYLYPCSFSLHTLFNPFYFGWAALSDDSSVM